MTKTGFDHNLYRGTAGSAATTKMTNVIDINDEDSRTDIDDTTHGSGGFKSHKVGLRDLGLTFNMLKDGTNADYVAVRTAYAAGTALSFAITDGAGDGIDADYVITDFKKGMPIDDKATVDVTIKVTTATRAPVVLTTEPTPAGGGNNQGTGTPA